MAPKGVASKEGGPFNDELELPPLPPPPPPLLPLVVTLDPVFPPPEVVDWGG